MASRSARVLAVVATDATFVEDARVGGFVGKCIHCRTKLVVTRNGHTSATIEHVLPQCHGGADDAQNLALACARCNHEKGVRHDVRRARDPVFVAIVEALRTARMKRWRDPIFPIATKGALSRTRIDDGGAAASRRRDS